MTLDRLEDKGLIASALSAPVPERGGGVRQAAAVLPLVIWWTVFSPAR